jgi:hypothetical protein
VKVLKRSYSLDMLAVEQGERRITIMTHGMRVISFSARDGKEEVGQHEFTFDQLFQLLKNLKPGIADICTPT